MLDAASSREVFDNGDIFNIALVHSKNNLADGKTKIMSETALRTMLTKGTNSVQVVQAILRNDSIDQVIT